VFASIEIRPKIIQERELFIQSGLSVNTTTLPFELVGRFFLTAWEVATDNL
jgi:hypothetical protein